jgi:putative cell wall-binding protein
MTLTRRTLLKASLVGAAVLASPMSVLAQPLGPQARTSRTSRLFPDKRLIHADLHNHSHLSDGAGVPEKAFATMRANGLDAAALTDHASVSFALGPVDVCAALPTVEGERDGCRSARGLTEAGWQQTLAMAEEENADGAFTAIGGFEWSSPFLGHMNVWFSERWIDVVTTGGAPSTTDLSAFIHEIDGQVPSPIDGITAPVLNVLRSAIRQAPSDPQTMRGFYQWLTQGPGTPVLGGGNDGIAGWNHPGREAGRFSEFGFDPALRDRVVSLELFNRGEDYLFRRPSEDRDSPLVACLDRGWKPGILGVSDHHGTDWGGSEDTGRAGLWVSQLTRNGVREALEQRRFFATRERGVRVDAALNGVRMGGDLGHRGGSVRVEVDIDRGPEHYGRPIMIQVLRTGSPLPTVVTNVAARYRRPDEPWIAFDVNLDPEDGRWIVLRITEPEEPADNRADALYAGFGNAVAYTSPVWLDPDLDPPAVRRAPGNPAAGRDTGGGDPRPPTGEPVRTIVRRRSGSGRAETAVEVSRAHFPVGRRTVWVATGEDFPDALAGGPAAAREEAPILLVGREVVPAATRQELLRLEPEEIVLLGGTGAVSQRVEDELRAIAPITRLGGADRFATAALVSRRAFPQQARVVHIATGTVFADALAGVPAAAGVGGPILLVAPNQLPPVVAEELRRLSPEHVVVLGGAGAVRDDVAAEIRRATGAEVSRVAGGDRFDTAARVAGTFEGAGTVFVATGEDFPDALAAGPAAARLRGPVLLVARDLVPAPVDAQLRRLGPRHIELIGGTGAVSARVAEQLAAYEVH